MQRAHAERLRLALDGLHDARAEAAPAEGGPQVEVVDEGVAALVLEAPAEAERDVARALAGILDPPEASEGRIGDEAVDRLRMAHRIEGIALLGVELAHPVREGRDLFEPGETQHGGQARRIVQRPIATKPAPAIHDSTRGCTYWETSPPARMPIAAARTSALAAATKTVSFG